MVCWTPSPNMAAATLSRAWVSADLDAMVPLAAFGEGQSGEDPFRFHEMAGCGDG